MQNTLFQQSSARSHVVVWKSHCCVTSIRQNIQNSKFVFSLRGFLTGWKATFRNVFFSCERNKHASTTIDDTRHEILGNIYRPGVEYHRLFASPTLSQVNTINNTPTSSHAATRVPFVEKQREITRYTGRQPPSRGVTTTGSIANRADGVIVSAIVVLWSGHRGIMGTEQGVDMLQTFDFGSIEEMDPSVGELSTAAV